MRFIRKYSAFLMPVGIVFVAVVLFVPTMLTGRSIRKDMEASKTQGSKIASMQNNTPPKAQANVEKLYQSEHKKDVDEVVQLARQSTQRELISYNIFPKPKDTSQQVFIQFGAQYRTAIEELIKGMDALDAPSDIDIRKETETDADWADLDIGGRFGMLGMSGRTTGKKKNSRDAIVDAVCYKRAEAVSVYANPNSFLWYGFWESYTYSGLDAALEDCWHSQVAYWIYEDVAATINNMNAAFDCVYNSPVKRFVGVSFSRPAEYVDTTGMGYSAVSVSDEPGYIIDNGPSVLGVQPWTGRICNDDIDVIHFNMSVILDTKSFMPFMKELCTQKEHKYREGYSLNGTERTFKHNQITILQSKIEPLDRKAIEHSFYRYGDCAVARLSLTCEYIFNRSGYDRIKPEPIKVLLDQSAAKKDASNSGFTGEDYAPRGGTQSSTTTSPGTSGDGSGLRKQQDDPFDF